MKSAAKKIPLPEQKVVTEEEFYGCSFSNWLGYKMQKNPLDLLSYHNLIYDLRPDILIECGTWHGGSAYYFATLMDALNHGAVLTIDPWKWDLRPKHPRIYYIGESSVDEKTVALVGQHAVQVPRVMVILDSLHVREHVLKELDFYSPFVTPGSYLVVEDTNIHGHPLRLDLPEGPWEAVHEWLPEHPEFVIDKAMEPPISNCPDGWLRRIK
jgi:cephalosporin hydroxylase